MTEPTPPAGGPKFADAVLEGGGVRGIGHVGAISVAEKLGYQWVNIAGTSAGAIVASMMAANYSAAEMYEHTDMQVVLKNSQQLTAAS